MLEIERAGAGLRANATGKPRPIAAASTDKEFKTIISAIVEKLRDVPGACKAFADAVRPFATRPIFQP